MLTKRLLKPMAACFLAAAIFTVSCKKDGNESPVIIIVSPENNQQFLVDDTVFISVNSYDKDGHLSNLSIYIDDNEVFSSPKGPYVYTWPTTGIEASQKTIKVVAADLEMETSTTEIQINLVAVKPEAAFTTIANNILPNNAVKFIDKSLRRPTSWLWDFGDGQQSTEQNPSHTYTTMGEYDVKLTVTNGIGESSITKTKYVNVIEDVLYDVDGFSYGVVQIGDQVWMAANLKTIHYADGTAIPNGAGLILEDNSSTPAYYFEYNDNEFYPIYYGRLYNKAAMLRGYTTAESVNDTIQGVCPDGWHVPTMQEWHTLIDYLGGKEVAGGKLKAAGTDYWKSPNLGATNESGFNARGAGLRHPFNTYVAIKEASLFGSSTKQNIIELDYHAEATLDSRFNNITGVSVRCIKD